MIPSEINKKLKSTQPRRKLSSGNLAWFQTRQEIMQDLLTSLPDHERIVKMPIVINDTFPNGFSKRMSLQQYYASFDSSETRAAQTNPDTLFRFHTFSSDILRGLEFLHQHSVLHRCLNPITVCVNFSAPWAPRIELTDFSNSVKLVQGKIVHGDCLIGSESGFLFFPVENFYGEYSEFTDLFSVGCLLWYILFEGKHSPLEDQIKPRDTPLTGIDIFYATKLVDWNHLIQQAQISKLEVSLIKKLLYCKLKFTAGKALLLLEDLIQKQST
jgi:serine/threonine protein kinase